MWKSTLRTLSNTKTNNILTNLKYNLSKTIAAKIIYLNKLTLIIARQQLKQITNIGLGHLQCFVFREPTIISQRWYNVSEFIESIVQAIHASTFTRIGGKSSFFNNILWTTVTRTGWKAAVYIEMMLRGWRSLQWTNSMRRSIMSFNIFRPFDSWSFAGIAGVKLLITQWRPPFRICANAGDLSCAFNCIAKIKVIHEIFICLEAYNFRLAF